MERLVCEFAVDPTAIDDWQTLRFLDASFGWERGRLIARFPKDWFQMVYERLAKGLASDTKVEICLQSLKGKLIRLGRPKKLGPGNWLSNARHEHARFPFRAIIARENPDAEPFILKIDELHDTTPLWQVPTDSAVPRDAEEMAAVIAHLLCHATEVTFIDPYFHPKKKKFTYPLQAFCKAAKNPAHQSKTFHYHLAKSAEWVVAQFEADCHAELPFMIPVGITVEFHIWSERLGGQSFHDRFVCFREGAIFWGQGLDDSPHTDGVVNVRLLSDAALKLRSSEFAKETSPFDWVHSIRVEGKRGA
jgi:hypothetical protein